MFDKWISELFCKVAVWQLVLYDVWLHLEGLTLLFSGLGVSSALVRGWLDKSFSSWEALTKAQRTMMLPHDFCISSRGGWRATVHGVAQRQTWWKRLSTHTHTFHLINNLSKLNSRQIFIAKNQGKNFKKQVIQLLE